MCSFTLSLLQMLSDLKWGDWRPHLAMMLSNITSRPETDRKHIITLGDTLGERAFYYSFLSLLLWLFLILYIIV